MKRTSGAGSIERLFLHARCIVDPAEGSLPHRGRRTLSRPVAEMMERHKRLEAMLGCVEAAEAASSELDGIHMGLGRLADVSADRVFLGSSNTDCWARAFAAVDLHEGDVLLAGDNEWGGTSPP